jgi:monofunctional chorismate mutase
MKLDEWRSEIDEIDGEIVALLERRAKVSHKIGALKAHAGLPIADPEREANIIRRLNAKSTGAMPGDSLGRIYNRILHESRSIQADAIAAAHKNSVEV